MLNINLNNSVVVMYDDWVVMLYTVERQDGDLKKTVCLYYYLLILFVSTLDVKLLCKKCDQ